jgi:hypothetical protein
MERHHQERLVPVDGLWFLKGGEMKVIRFLGAHDAFVITAEDWSNSQGITGKNVPEKMVWWYKNGWTIREDDFEGGLADEILDYFSTDPLFAVLEEKNELYVPHLQAKRKSMSYSGMQMSRAAAEDVDPVEAARHLGASEDFIHVGPTEVPGVTDTRPEGAVPGDRAGERLDHIQAQRDEEEARGEESKAKPRSRSKN